MMANTVTSFQPPSHYERAMKRKKGYGLERLGEALNELAEHKGRNTVRNRKFFRGTAYTFTRGGWVGHVRELARNHSEKAIETLVDLMRHAKSDAARGAAAQALLDRGYGKSVAVSMDVVDEGQAHLDTLHEMIEQRERINREKALAEAG